MATDMATDMANATASQLNWPPSAAVPPRYDTFIKTILAILVICICTRIASEYRFRSVRDGKHTSQPPTIPYWIPFIRHAFSMAWDNQRFAAKCFQQYGDGTPFFINAAGKKILILLDPSIVKKVLNASQDLSPNPFIHEMILGQMLGSPKEMIDFYRGDNGHMDHVQMAHIRQHVTGSSLDAISDKLFERLLQSVNQAYRETDDSGWMTIPDFYSFIQYHITRATTESLMGSSISEQCPTFYEDQWIFMDRSVEIVTGLPRWIVPAAYNARDKLLAEIKKWNSTSEALRMEGKADTQWDSVAGSGLLQERQERYVKTPGFNEDARVSQTLGLLFAGNGFTPPVSFWYLFHAMSDTSIRARITSELHTQQDPSLSTYNFTSLASNPLLQSLHAEATRCYAANVGVRVLTSPTFFLSDKYVISKNTLMFIYTSLTSIYTPGWTRARPHTTSKPLTTFWPKRFLMPNPAGKDKEERYSDAGLSGCWTSFGGGEHKCPGRQFALNIGIITLAVLLGEYETEFVDEARAASVVPKMGERAFGKVVPTERVAVRIRRRVK